MKIYIGEALRTFREDKKASQEQLASEVGISQAMLSKLERNELEAKLDLIIHITKITKDKTILTYWQSQVMKIIFSELIS